MHKLKVKVSCKPNKVLKFHKKLWIFFKNVLLYNYAKELSIT